MPKIPATRPATGNTTASQFITCKEAALLLKLSEITIRRFLTQKKLKRYKVGTRTLILQADALALIREAE
jgi:excisionase family DNA binding protein